MSTDTDLADDDALVPLFGNDAALVVATFVGVYVLYVVLGLLAGIPPRGVLSTLVELTFTIGIVAMVALALNLHWGYTGLFNIGVVGFMGAGAYTLFILVKPPADAAGVAASYGGFGLPFSVGLIGGIVVAALFGLIAALPALRLRADYLAIVTIALAEIFRLGVTSNTFREFTLFGNKVGTGGGSGLLRNFQDPLSAYIYGTNVFGGFVGTVDDIWGAQTTLQPILESAVEALVLLAFVIGFYWLLQRTGGSPFGRVLKAIREDEDVARALGKNTDLFKIKSFMLGCGLMGLVGILWVIYGLGQLNPLTYRPNWTFYFWVALIIGGAGSNTGSVMGSALFVAVLFRGPLYLRNVVTNIIDVGGAPGTIAPAIGALFSLDPTPLIAYTFAQMNTFRLVLMGIILIWLMKRRPDGILGHRTETASAIPLSSSHARALADGGEEE